MWPTAGMHGLQIAPFQLLATEGRTWTDHDHQWHLEIADRLVTADPELVRPTRRLIVDTADSDSTAAGEKWWDDLTNTGGEGMVVKPLANLVRTGRGYGPARHQGSRPRKPAHHLRPDYTEPANLARLRDRNPGHKRSLAAREYALDVESLERATRREPLWRIHEPVFAVLAHESEPIDPRPLTGSIRRSLRPPEPQHFAVIRACDALVSIDARSAILMRNSLDIHRSVRHNCVHDYC